MLCVLLLACFATVVNGRDIKYYVAAVEIDWQYSGSGEDLIQSSLVANSERTVVSSSVYKKVVYRQYTDWTFTVQSPRDDYLGVQGPVLMGNVGDTFNVTFKNMANQNFSIHPQALTYDKANEGSKYPDQNVLSSGASVAPGNVYTYRWQVSASSGPQTDDGQCVTTLYYSDVDMIRDIHSGLVGQMIICKAGILVTRPQIRQFSLMFMNFDETLNHLNNSQLVSSSFSTINGFAYGHLPTLDACIGDHVSFHMTSVGGSDDVRTITLYDHSFIFKDKRYTSIVLYPGAARTITFTAHAEGKWLLTSQHPRDLKNGMQGIFKSTQCNVPALTMDMSGKIRSFYISAEVTDWNDGSHVSQRLHFVGYTDIRFINIKPKTDTEDYMGIMGPLIAAETGDTVRVVLYNKASRPLSLHPHGLRVGKPYEGVFYNDSDSVKNMVMPGTIKTYYWTVPEFVSPTLSDEPCLPRYYVSGTGNGPDSDLFGPIIVCGQGTLDQNDKPFGQTDIFLVFKGKDTHQEINGFRNTSMLTPFQFCVQDAANVHILGIDIHTPQSVTVSGNYVTRSGSKLSVVELLTGHFSSATLFVVNTGSWSIHNTANDGVRVNYRVEPCASQVSTEHYQQSASSVVNIGITETDTWNYLKSSDTARWRGKLNTNMTLGSSYKKVLYKEYYTTVFFYPIPDDQFFGPLFVEQTGRIKTIELKNLASRDYGLGVIGMPANCSTVLSSDEVATVKWYIPTSLGPGSADPPCVVRLYTSNVDTKRDKFSGLMGPLIVCREDINDASFLEPERHHVFFVGVVDETKSWLIQNNIGLNAKGKITNLNDPEFIKANTFHILNGESNFPVKTKSINRNEDIFLHFMNIGYKFHSIHIHGNLITDRSTNYVDRSTLALFPGATISVKVRLGNMGDWLIEEFTTKDNPTRFYASYTIPQDEDGVAN